MRKFTPKILLFLLPLFILSFTMEYLLRTIPNEYNYKREYLTQNSNNINKLFLGSSHAYFGVNPDFISGKAFNAAHISQSIDLDYEIIKKYKNDWENLEYIIIPIDYFTLFSRLSTSKIEAWRIKNYNLYYGMNLSLNLSDNSELLNTNLKTNVNRIKKYYLHNESSIKCSRLGFGQNFEQSADLIKSGKEAAHRHTIEDLHYLEENIEIIQNMIDFASEHNIQVILYTSPAYKTYVSNLDKKQLNLTIKTATTLSENNENCFYFNLLENQSFNSENFRDADHFNPTGAKKFSILLDNLIKENT